MPELVPESSDGESDEEVTFAEKRMTTYAKLLWGDPEQIRAALLKEAEMNGATAEVEQHISDYRKEQLAKADPDLAKQVRDDIALRISADKERLLRERDVHYFPLQQAAEGVRYLTHQVRGVDWDKDSAARKVISRKIVVKLLKRMVQVRPPPAFDVHQHVQHTVYDNTYATTGMGLGSQKDNSIERVDQAGDEVSVLRMTYINSFRVAINAKECVLTEQDVALIARRGPYTRDFQRVLAPRALTTWVVRTEELFVVGSALATLANVRLRRALGSWVSAADARALSPSPLPT